ncbi:MAG: hypothetical protein ACE5GB_04890 [Acidimicrobiales bacterium]
MELSRNGCSLEQIVDAAVLGTAYVHVLGARDADGTVSCVALRDFAVGVEVGPAVVDPDNPCSVEAERRMAVDLSDRDDDQHRAEREAASAPDESSELVGVHEGTVEPAQRGTACRFECAVTANIRLILTSDGTWGARSTPGRLRRNRLQGTARGAQPGFGNLVDRR